MSRSLNDLFLTLLSAILLNLAFPNFNLWPLAFVAFVPMFYLAARIKHPQSAFAHFYLLGFLFLLISVEWLRHVTYFGWVFAALLFAVYFGLFGMVVWWFWSRGKFLLSLAALPACWAVLEWSRTELPVWSFGWNLLGYSQSANLPFASLAAWVGAYGVSAAVMAVNVALAVSVRTGTAIILIIFATAFLSNDHLRSRRGREEVRVAVLQSNIPQADKWDPAKKHEIIQAHLELSRFVSLDQPDLIVWPEAAFPGYWNRDPDRKSIVSLVQELKIPILLGSPHLESDMPANGIAYNSAYLADPSFGGEGREGIQRYDKIRLVPFGEYVPWRWLFGPFGLERLAYALGVSDFYAGKEMKVFSLASGRGLRPLLRRRFSTLICFEDIFPSLAREAVHRGAEFLTVITNDAWFSISAAPYQHLQASQFRAIENGVPVVRSANTGVSAFVNERGKVLDRIRDKKGHDIFIGGGLVRSVSIGYPETFYRKAGFWFPQVCLVILGLSMMAARRGRKKSVEPGVPAGLR